MKQNKTLLLASGLTLMFGAGAALAAQSWGVQGEEETRFQAQVVDILCELTGDCADNCGDGSRQLGLLTPEGQLILPVKNNIPFAGAADELVDFCQMAVEVDGIFTQSNATRLFAVQFVRPLPEGDWRRANRFYGRWAERNGADPQGEANQWFRHDPKVNSELAEHGLLGLGLEEDEKFLETW